MSRESLIGRAEALSRDISLSGEYTEYLQAREKAFENPSTKALIDRYHSLQLKAQGSMLSGKKAENTVVEELQKLGELLQFQPAASRYLMAEYTLHELMAQVYGALGSCLDMDMPYPEEEEEGEESEKEADGHE